MRELISLSRYVLCDGFALYLHVCANCVYLPVILYMLVIIRTWWSFHKSANATRYTRDASIAGIILCS